MYLIAPFLSLRSNPLHHKDLSILRGLHPRLASVGDAAGSQRGSITNIVVASLRTLFVVVTNGTRG